VSSLFVHSGFLHLIADAAGLVVVGILLERLVGHFAFATVYVAAGLFATLASVSDNPMTVTVGASGAVFGVYGLLAASAIWGLFKRSLAISLLALKKMAPGAAVFLLYNLATGRVDTAALNGLAIGFMGGLVLAWGVHERKPPAVRIAATFATTVVAVVAFAVPLRGFIDVKPSLAELVAVEDRTAGAYEKAVEQFRLGAMAAEALAQVIHRTILPDLAAMRERVAALDTAPAEHQPLVASAKEYLRLRDESWRLRAEGLQSHNMLTLRKADRAERASLDALEAFRPSVDR
jgi:rhomboid protease GluP